MQHFVLIFGPPAVGKMTVAYALAERLGFKVFHNHMSIEIFLPLFEFGTPEFFRLNRALRFSVFQEVASSNIPGFIFTYVWALEEESEKNYIGLICDIFVEKGWKIHFVELEASLEERLYRNETEFRLAQKASKRDISASKARLLRLENSSRKTNSNGDFLFSEQYIKINNTELTPQEVAEHIVTRFSLAD